MTYSNGGSSRGRYVGLYDGFSISSMFGGYFIEALEKLLGLDSEGVIAGVLNTFVILLDHGVSSCPLFLNCLTSVKR